MRTEHVSRESLFSVVKAEPERAKLLAKVGAGGALALSVWSWVGDSVMADIVFLPLTLVLVVVYSAALVVLTGSLVRDADRWQVESALQARRLMSTGNRQQQPVEPAEPAPATFDHWYFVLRLDDEIKRARRTGSQVSVIIMKIAAPGQDATPAITEQINFDMANMAASHAKTMTMPSAIGPLEYAFLLPGTDRGEAKARVAPLLSPLGDYWCEFGIAVYPDDATEAETLVLLARRQIQSAAAA